METTLAKIWSEVLGVEKIGRNDNFFDLGGHSLLAVRMLELKNRTSRQEIAIRIADAEVHASQLGQRRRPGGGRHPCRRLDPLAEGRDDVGDDGLQPGLVLGREVALDVHLSDGVVHGRSSRLESTLRARAGLLRTRCDAMQGHRLGVKRTWQHVAMTSDHTDTQIVLPRG